MSNTKECPACAEEIKQDAMKCPHCEETLKIECPYCAELTDKSLSNCQECNGGLSLHQERTNQLLDHKVVKQSVAFFKKGVNSVKQDYKQRGFQKMVKNKFVLGGIAIALVSLILLVTLVLTDRTTHLDLLLRGVDINGELVEEVKKGRMPDVDRLVDEAADALDELAKIGPAEYGNTVRSEFWLSQLEADDEELDRACASLKRSGVDYKKLKVFKMLSRKMRYLSKGK